MAIGVYIHLPFCKTRCFYCDFYSQTDPSFEDRLIQSIASEIRIAGKAFPDVQIETIYLGGGTPSFLKTDSLRIIINELFAQFSILGKVPEMEISIEANPDDLISAKLGAYREMGISRISLGAQSFMDSELKLLGRRHDATQIHKAVAMIRACGFDNYSLDLIFALPGQTRADLTFSLKEAVLLTPKHISLYCLSYEKGTRLFERASSGGLRPLDEGTQAEMLEEGILFLTHSGYIQYETSNYALPGYECRHNLNYWRMGGYLGFGPSAHSFLNGKRWANVADINKYVGLLEENRIPMDFEEVVTPERKAEEFIMLSLRLREGLDLERHRKMTGRDLRTIRKAELAELVSRELAQIHGKYLRLTTKGMLLADEITTRLL